MILTLYIIIPLILYLFPCIFSKFILLNTAFFTLFTNLDKPSIFKFSYKNWRNFRIKNEYSQYELGVWKIISEEDEDVDLNYEKDFLSVFSNGRPIIIYFHGITMHRGSDHRVQLYHMLRKAGYHIIAVDYRGFGDSAGSVHNEEELLEDAFVTYNHVKSVAPNSPLFIWGHSLGTGISSLLLQKLSKMGCCSSINGLILESPFTSILETMDNICFTWPWRCMPYFHRIFKQSLVNQKLTFNSIENLKDVNVPIFILHAEDDGILTFKMGEKLYSTLNAAGKVVFFKCFPFNLGYGHKHIIYCPELPSLIRKFTTKAINQKITGEKMIFDSDLL